ncbi:MAG: hypothetical protein LJE61_04730 [Thiocapsa sp.]|jgi:uncharacterized protein YoxC|nr:hypothetical protein [Thiocapsa sp.]MCG6898343.1 hypothetical protein [Thiocapsa sp.]MCG6984498.1 hypothetical protein [Thiocapsa sp.]
MSAAASPVLPRLALIAIAILAGIGFLYMVKLMHDISRNVGVMAVEMASMSANMDRMGTDMSSLATDVSDMARQVRTLPAMAQDIQQMRVAIDGLSGIVGGGEQLQQMNPMGVIQQMIPGPERR